MDCSWMGVGSVIPISAIAAWIGALNAMPSKEVATSFAATAGTSIALGEALSRVSARAGARWRRF